MFSFLGGQICSPLVDEEDSSFSSIFLSNVSNGIRGTFLLLLGGFDPESAMEILVIYILQK